MQANFNPIKEICPSGVRVQAVRLAIKLQVKKNARTWVRISSRNAVILGISNVKGLMLLAVLVYNEDTPNSTTKIILGGEWFTSTNTGEDNGYLMTEFKDKFFEPIIQ